MVNQLFMWREWSLSQIRYINTSRAMEGMSGGGDYLSESETNKGKGRSVLVRLNSLYVGVAVAVQCARNTFVVSEEGTGGEEKHHTASSFCV